MARRCSTATRSRCPWSGSTARSARHPDGTRFHAVPFPPEAAAEALAAFEAGGLPPCVYVAEPDVDVVLPADAASHPGHLESLPA